MRERVCPLLFFVLFCTSSSTLLFKYKSFPHPPRHRPLPFCICPLFIFTICIFVGDCFSVFKKL
ncbi:unnamed protein product [Meloidogyne enterolobii]|uniref:Uncharacterized protein n=1 Tax=Meloidogyne enterolobii TaxID=390850 RepID=A0ACB1AUT3_MELEN